MLTLFCALWGAFALLLPTSVGEALLGSTWEPARAVLLPTIVSQIGSVLSSGPSMGLRTFAAARRSLRVSLINSVVAVVLGVGGAIAAGVDGAAWGLAAAALISAGLWWRAFLLEMTLQTRLRRPSEAGSSGGQADQPSPEGAAAELN